MTLPDTITIAGLLAAYRSGRLSPAHALADFMAAAGDPTAVAPNDAAWIMRASEIFIRAQLAALDGHSPDDRPLFGVPFAVKDNIDVAGLPTSAACPAFTQVPERSATVVERLMAAGAIVVGKTNLDQFATGLVGTRSPYGAPTSTFSQAHVSGGSSSGSGVVVARGEVPFALGTDTAGSGRVPAGFNNIVGLKPTPGLVPTRGVLPACKTLDCVSVFALTASDAARVLAVIEGPEPGEPVFHSLTLQPPHWPGRLRVGVPNAPRFHGDTDYERAFGQACASWSNLADVAGRPWMVEQVTVDMAVLHEVAGLLYEGPWVAERYAALRVFMKQQADDMNPVVRGIIEQARDMDAASVFEGLYRLKDLAARCQAMWNDIDVLMVPTAPTMPTLDSVAADPVGRNAQLGTYTNFVNLLGLSALALPASITPAGLPFGITLIAPGGRDAALADLGQCWQRLVSQTPGLPLGHHLGAPSAGDLAPPDASGTPRAEATLALAVVGAHLQGMPLHGQLVERRAVLIEATSTAPRYQLHALPGTIPPKPGLVRVAPNAPPHEGHAIEIEVYEMPQSTIGSFLALIAAPLGLGSVELADGRWVKGFICEPCGLAGAEDISHFGGWRAYIAHRQTATAATAPSGTASTLA